MPFSATVFEVEFPTVVEFPVSLPVVVVLELVLVVSVVLVVVLLVESTGGVGLGAVSKSLSNAAGALEFELVVVVVSDWQVSPANWTTKVAQRTVSKKYRRDKKQ